MVKKIDYFLSKMDSELALVPIHRLSSCRFCNSIVVFNNGKIVQFGNHEELLKDKSGKYFELWNAQAQYYQ